VNRCPLPDVVECLQSINESASAARFRSDPIRR
jgi:hypothetical protein